MDHWSCKRPGPSISTECKLHDPQVSTIISVSLSLLSISPAGRGQLVKMLITLEPHGIFGSIFAYLFILTLSSHWYAKR